MIRLQRCGDRHHLTERRLATPAKTIQEEFPLYATAWARALAALTLSLSFASCGGGESPAPSVPPQSAALQVSSARTPSATALMDWAQTAYPAVFPGRKGNLTTGAYLYRYYPETGNYLGTAGDAVYVLGPVSNGALKQVGTLSDFGCSVYPDSCAPGAADSRNGSYTAYLTTGERFTLTIDFDSAQYATGSPEVTLGALPLAGTFAGDSAAGSYVFQGDGMGATTRFRYVDDLIVGTFPSAAGVKPFIAARVFAQSIAEAAGSYSSFGINHANNADDSRIFTERINTNGTLQICNDNVIYSIASCPAASLLTYTLVVSGDLFTATPTGAAASLYSAFNFRVAKAANENIFLMGAINYTDGTRFFRVAVGESAAFTGGTARGGTTLGEWGTATYTTTSYASTGLALDGHSISLSGSLSTMGTLGPSGMRILQAGSPAFVMQNTQLGLLLGPRGSVAAGYLQIGSK